jgi:large repetitive protein
VSGATVTLNGTAEANSTITAFDNSTQLGTVATNSAGSWTYTTGALASGSQSFTATATDGAGNLSTSSLGLAVIIPAGSGEGQAPTITGISESPAKGDLNAGKTGALTLTFSEAVTVAGGKPTLTLNDGGTATYASGSGGKTLTFTYTVAAGQNVASLTATAINLASGVSIQDSASNTANLSLAGLTQSGPQIDTTTPTITGISESPATADLGLYEAVAFTLAFSEPVTVAGGRPTLTLNDGGTAYYQVGSSTNTLTFYYHVAPGENIASLAATTVNLPSGATINDRAGNAAKLSLTSFSQSGPQIDTTKPTVTSVIASPGTGTQLPGDPITITLKMSEAVTVTGGAPMLLLNDLGAATYVSGSGTNTLTFKYTVGATDKDVSTLGIWAVQVPAGVAIKDSAGNSANMAGAIHSFAGLAVDPPIVSTKPDGSYDVAYSEVTGLSYSSYEDIFNSAGLQVAEARDMIGGAGTLILDADHLTVSSSSGSFGVTTGSDKFKVNSHGSESIIASGRTAETFALGSGFGHESITGLLTSGASHDLIDLPSTLFKGLSSTNTATQNWNALLSSGAAVQSGANVTITDAAHDVLTLNNAAISTLSRDASSLFKFV